MIRVIRTGGKQYLVSPNQSLVVEKLSVEAGNATDLEVLLEADNEMSETPTVRLGEPSLSSGGQATVTKHAKGKKIAVVKYKRKVRYRRRTGHRQQQSTIQIAA